MSERRSTKRCVTLTFDNGPTRGVTDAVLDTLRHFGVTATFFVVGDRLAVPGARPLVERAVSEGHRIGNHTRTHLTRLGDIDHDLAALDREVDGCQAMLANLSRARLFRPYGRGGTIDEHLLGPNGLSYLSEGGYTCVLWNAVPRDWEQPSDWVATALEQVAAQPWSLVVLHDTATGAMQHLPAFLTALAELDVEVVTEFPPSCVVLDSGERSEGLAMLPWLGSA
jgi:peptidoglycan-N-acetylglucosamine deacetylase